MHCQVLVLEYHTSTIPSLSSPCAIPVSVAADVIELWGIAYRYRYRIERVLVFYSNDRKMGIVLLSYERLYKYPTVLVE